MKKPLMSVSKTLVLTFFLIGIVFLASGIVMLGFAYDGQERTVKVTGTIVDFDSGQMPIVEYVRDDCTYTTLGHVRSSRQRVGDPYELRVDPNDPHSVSDGALMILGKVFSIVGGVLFAVAIIVALAARSMDRERELLLRSNQRATAIVREIRPNYALRCNGRHPFRVYAECINPVSGALETLASHNVWQVNAEVGDMVEIAFDPNDAKRYAFDLSGDAKA